MDDFLGVEVAEACDDLLENFLGDAFVEEATYVGDQVFMVATIAEVLDLVEIFFFVVEELYVFYDVVVGKLFHNLQLHPYTLPPFRVQLRIISPNIRPFRTFHCKICLVRIALRLDHTGLHAAAEYFQ